MADAPAPGDAVGNDDNDDSEPTDQDDSMSGDLLESSSETEFLPDPSQLPVQVLMRRILGLNLNGFGYNCKP